jgi:hypothetical protein
MTKQSNRRVRFWTTRGALSVASLALLGTQFPDALAASPPKSGESSIKACSRNGHGCITTLVRQGRQGPEVRMPSGTWISCAGDCRDTVIEKTLDFWDKQLEVAPETGG